MRDLIERVIIVTDNAHVNGGSGKVALSSAIALHRQGVPTTIFSAVGPVEEALRSEPGLEVICLGQADIFADPNRLAAASRGIWNSAARAAMKRLLATTNPRRTIVHVHAWTKALSSSVVGMAIDEGFPVVATLHEYFTACPLGSFFDHKRQAICTVRPLGPACLTRNCDPRNAAHKVWRVTRQVVQKTLGHIPGGIRHFITISDLSEEVLRPYLPQNAILHSVLNPIDIVRRAAVSPDKNDCYVFMGRLSHEKGATLFARAAAKLSLKALFVGDGECVDEVLAICPTAEVTGWMKHEDAMKRMCSARALVLPSLWYENAPLVVVEAAAIGLPSVVPDTCAARESIDDGVTGLMYRGGSIDELTSKLALLRDDQLTQRLGATAYANYWQRPQSMGSHIEALLSVYAQILTGSTIARRTRPSRAARVAT